MEKFKKAKSKPSLSLNIILNILYEILVLIIPFITTPYVSRVLGPASLGSYSFSHSLVVYFTLFAALGTASYGKITIAKKRDDIIERSKCFWEIELISIFTSVLTILMWIAFSFIFAEYRLLLLILSLNILSVLFDISWFYIGIERIKYTVAVNALFKIVGVILIFLFVKKSSDTWVYVLILSGSILLGNISMWFFLPRNICKTSIKFENLKIHFKETLVYFIPSIASTIYAVIDKTLIGFLIPGSIETYNENNEIITSSLADIENGYYEQATKLINILKTVCFISINNVMTARSSYYFGKQQDLRAKKLALTGFNINMFFSIGAAFGLVGIAKDFVPVFFGAQYNKVIYLVYLLAIIVVIIGISNTYGSLYYTPSGRRKQSTKFLLIGCLVNIFLNIPLIIWLKSYGAVIASIIAELIITILYVFNARRFVSFKEIMKLVWKKMIAGIMMLVFIISFSFLLENYLNKYLLLVLEIILGFSTYFLLLLVFKDNSILNTFGFIKSFLRNKNRSKNEQPIVEENINEVER